MNPALSASDPDASRRALAERLAQHVSALTGQRAAAELGARLAGGFSWQTYPLRLTMAPPFPERELDLILRIGPATGLLAPYSTLPEACVLQALKGSRVPIPELLWHSDDAAILGAPFVVMRRAPGTPHSPFERRAAPTEDTAALGQHFVEVLAALHNCVWPGSPAARLAPHPTPETAAAAELERWSHLIDESGLAPRPVLHCARHWLRRHAPVAPRICIVHGDYRAGNFLHVEGRITAVLDWELVHLGDPHDDIAWAGLRFLGGGSDLVSGLISREAFATRYTELTGITLQPASIRYYEVMGLYKICAMNLRAAGRVEQGTAADGRMTALGLGLPRLESELARLLLEAA